MPIMSKFALSAPHSFPRVLGEPTRDGTVPRDAETHEDYPFARARTPRAPSAAWMPGARFTTRSCARRRRRGPRGGRGAARCFWETRASQLEWGQPVRGAVRRTRRAPRGVRGRARSRCARLARSGSRAIVPSISCGAYATARVPALPGVVVVCVGTNNLGRDNDSAADTFLGIRAVVLEILHRLPGTRVLLTGIPRAGPARGSAAAKTPGSRSRRRRPARNVYAAPRGRARDCSVTDARRAVRRRLFGEGLPVRPARRAHARHRGREREAPRARRRVGGSVGYCESARSFPREERRARRRLENPRLPLMRDALHPTAEGLQRWFAVRGPP